MVRTSSGWKHSLRRSHDQGIVAATGRRVFCLNKGRFSNNVTQIPYRGIQTVSETRPEEVRITRTRLDFGIMNTFEIRPLACAAAPFSSFTHLLRVPLGDCEGAMLRPGNVHSAHNWREVLDPIVARYGRTGVRRYFRADAAFAKPEVYEYLEERRVLYAIRLPSNEVLQWEIAR